jgi:hypothetical protein
LIITAPRAFGRDWGSRPHTPKGFQNPWGCFFLAAANSLADRTLPAILFAKFLIFAFFQKHPEFCWQFNALVFYLQFFVFFTKQTLP